MAQHRDAAGPNGYWSGGGITDPNAKRFERGSGEAWDPEAAAQAMGYRNADEWQQADPFGFYQEASAHAHDGQDTQVADQNGLDTHRLLNVLGGTVAAGAGASALADGAFSGGATGGATAAGSTAGTAAAPAGLTATTGLGALPAGFGAASIGAAPVAGTTAATIGTTATGGGSLIHRLGSALSGKGTAGKLIDAGLAGAGALAQGASAGRQQNLANTDAQGKIQQRAYDQALRSALAQNIQDVQITGLPEGVTMAHISGGARPSALGAQGRAAAGTNYDLAVNRLQNLPTTSPGTAENVLGALGAFGTGLRGARAEGESAGLVQRLLAAQMRRGTGTDTGSSEEG